MREDWERLGEYVVRARVDQGYRTQDSFATAAGISARTLRELEAGRKVARRTLALIESALLWGPGSAQAVLHGGEPTSAAVRTAAESRVDQARAQILDATPAELIRMRSLIEEVRGADEADAFLREALLRQEEARARAASNDTTTGRSAS